MGISFFKELQIRNKNQQSNYINLISYFGNSQMKYSEQEKFQWEFNTNREFSGNTLYSWTIIQKNK